MALLRRPVTRIVAVQRSAGRSYGRPTATKSELQDILRLSVRSETRNKASRQSPGGPFPHVYTRRITEAKNQKEVFRLLKEVRSEDIGPNLFHYAAAVRRLRDIRQWRQALEVFDRLRKDEDVMQSAALSASASARAVGSDSPEKGRPRKSSGSLVTQEQERARDAQILRQLHNEVLYLCGRTGQWQYAFRLLDDMYEGTMTPDSGNYTAALRACLKSRAPAHEPALALWAVMRERDPSLADGYSYDAMVSVCARAANWPMVRGLLQIRQTEGHPLTVTTYNSVLQGDLDMTTAHTVFDQMRRDGIAPE